MSTVADAQDLQSRQPSATDTNHQTDQFEKHRRLTEWTVEHGGFWHDAVQIVHTPEKGYYARVRHGHEVPSGTRIASCPMETTLSVLNALSISPFSNHGTQFPSAFLRQHETDTDILQFFYLMEQHVLGEASFWAPYIATLPDVQATGSLQFESEADMAWIQGTNLSTALVQQNARWRAQFEAGDAMLKSLAWPSAVENKYSFQLYRWAAIMFGSRSFTSNVLTDTAPADRARPMGRGEPDNELLSTLFTERFAVILPLLDILNHKPMAKVEWEARPTLVGLQMQEKYTEGEELFNNYGPTDNERLLMSYGFVLPDNPFDHVLIGVNVPPGSYLEIARSWPVDERSNETYNCYIFDVRHALTQESTYLERAMFNYDLLDSISIICANDREFQQMYQQRKSLMSAALPIGFDDFRNLLATLAQIMFDCRARAYRTEMSDPMRIDPTRVPQDRKQENAQIYRAKQVGILKSAVGLCAFVLLRASTDQQISDVLLTLQTRLPEYYSEDLASLCTRLRPITSKNELLTSSALINLLPSPTRSGIISCIEAIYRAFDTLTSSGSQATYDDRIKAKFSLIFAAMHLSSQNGTQLPPRISIWLRELTLSYPPDDENWAYIPEPGPYAPGDEPPPGLLLLLDVLPAASQAFAVDSAQRSWMQPKSICWGWNVMEEEGVRVPVEIERFTSEDPAAVEGPMGFLMYCKHSAY